MNDNDDLLWLLVLGLVGALFWYWYYHSGQSAGAQQAQANANDMTGLNGDGGLLTPGI